MRKSREPLIRSMGREPWKRKQALRFQRGEIVELRWGPNVRGTRFKEPPTARGRGIKKHIAQESFCQKMTDNFHRF